MARDAAYEAYLRSPEWQAKRVQALARALNRCQVCNVGTRLDVHHRTYERFGDEDLDDLTVLCRPCHEIFHGSGRKTQRVAKQSQKKKRTSYTAEQLDVMVIRLAALDSWRAYTNAEMNAAGVSSRERDHLKRKGFLRKYKKKWHVRLDAVDAHKGPPERLTPRLATREDIEALAQQMGARVRQMSRPDLAAKAEAPPEISQDERIRMNKEILRSRKAAKRMKSGEKSPAPESGSASVRPDAQAH